MKYLVVCLSFVLSMSNALAESSPADSEYTARAQKHFEELVPLQKQAVKTLAERLAGGIENSETSGQQSQPEQILLRGNVGLLVNDMETDSELSASLSNLLDSVSAERQAVLQPAEFNAVSRLIIVLRSRNLSQFRAQLENLYYNGYKADSHAKLAQAKKICEIIHPMMVRNKQVLQPFFARSEVYKRLLRRQMYLGRKRK